jgi:hypothetical protein
MKLYLKIWEAKGPFAGLILDVDDGHQPSSSRRGRSPRDSRDDRPHVVTTEEVAAILNVRVTTIWN